MILVRRPTYVFSPIALLPNLSFLNTLSVRCSGLNRRIIFFLLIASSKKLIAGHSLNVTMLVPKLCLPSNDNCFRILEFKYEIHDYFIFI